MKIIINEIKNIKFEKLDAYNIEKLLGQFSDYNLCFGTHPTFKIIVTLFYNLFIKKYHYNIYKERDSIPQVLFIYNHLNKRKDLLESFLKVAKCACPTRRMIIVLSNPLKDSFFNLSLIKDIKLVNKWYAQLKGTQLSIREKIETITYLYKCHELEKNLDQINNKELSLVVVNYDSFFLDNFSVQYFQKKGIKTATLQHGVMVTKRKGLENNIDFCGTEFKNSIADYFLVWNIFTKKQAIMSGIKEKKIVVTGPIKCININKIIEEKTERRVIGILLDGRFTEENNPNMIRIANQFCSQNNYKFILRYHPAYQGNEYNSIIDHSFYLGNSSNDLYEFAKEVDYILISNSTAYIELLYMNSKVIHFKCNPTTDKYRDLNIPSFSNASELYEFIKNKKYYNDIIKENLLSVIDVKSSYTKFFLKFIENEN